MSTTYTVGVRIAGSAADLARAAKEALAHTKQMSSGMGQEFAKMAKAREALGVRSEHAIQREIQKTEAAYNRLARSGAMSFDEQKRAARAMREEVTRLTNEMGRLTTRQKAVMGFKGAAALGGVATGAAMVIKPRLDRAMAYDLRLRHASNTELEANATQAQRNQKAASISGTVNDAVRYGGGNRDDALETYAQMVSKGSAFTGDLPSKLLPEIMKAATATDAAANDMARIAAAGIQNFGMGRTAKDAKDWFNIGAFGGKLGGFELKNQAQYLPEQMALGGMIGMSGKADFANLVMLNQAAEKTAGTPDKAATNVKLFMTDIGSEHFRHRVKKATGVNFTKYAVDNRLNNGVGMIDSAMELIDKQLVKHPAYQQVQKQIKNAKTDEDRRQALGSAEGMIRGSEISKFFHNQESVQTVAAYMMNKDFVKDGQRQALSGTDLIGANYGNIQASASYQSNKLAIESAAAMQSSMEKLTPLYGEMSSKVAGLMQNYPGYTAAIIAATGALGLLATAAGALTFAGFKLPGGSGSKLPSGTGPVSAGSGFSRFMGGAGKLLGPLGLLLGLEGISEEDIARLKAYEAKQAGVGAGKGLNDPRLVGGGGAAGAAALEQSLRATELKGEILVNVRAAPGLQVDASVASGSPRIPMRAALGQTNLATGF